MDQTTIPEPIRDKEVAPRQAVPALVIVDCPKEPWRLGEIAAVPALAGDEWIAFGRGAEPHSERPRLRFTRNRPTSIEAVAALGVEHISRLQALFRSDDDGRIHVRNVGRCKLFKNGQLTAEAVLSCGDVLQFGRQLMLLATTRAEQLPAPSSAYVLGEFGEPDAYGIVGESPAIWQLRSEISFLSRCADHVLVLGPSGAGKELVARAMHALSDRGARAFVARNAATIPEGIADAELFGNLRNYPNAGMPDRPGLIGQANGSVLFLDEISELPRVLQSHLLRVLDMGEYQRLGEAVSRISSFRLIAAANRPPESIKDDLRARFKLQVRVPGLNAHREDIPLLLRHLLRGIASADPQLGWPGARSLSPSPEFLLRLLLHDYHGHVRELEAIVWASLQSARGRELEWPLRLRASSAESSWSASEIQTSRAARTAIGLPGPAIEPAQPQTPQLIQRVLEEHNGRIEHAWKALGLKNRYALRRLIAKHRIEVRRRPGGPV
jgi:DNA-binding NtrC family response regulator